MLAAPSMGITIPHNFTPRQYQLPVLGALDNGVNRAVCVWHRRSGKDKVFLNFMGKKMYERKGSYFYFFPTYKQGKKILWNGMDREGFKFTDHIPQNLRKRTDNTEMLIEVDSGSIFQVIGTDNIDSVVGANPIGCVFSEYSLQDPKAWKYIRPILAENGGWAIFNYTPRGKNHGHSLFKLAKESKDWFCQKLTVDDTQAITPDVLEQERLEIIKEDGNDALFMQEYYCSFDVPIKGSYYGNQLMVAERDGRVTRVPHETSLPVHTAWDLGVGDTNPIWFFQVSGREVRLIDFYQNSGQGLEHYVKVLQDKGYVYGKHIAPHDIEVRELGTGKSRREVAKSLGIDFIVAPNLSIDDGISASRQLISRCWFDELKTDEGLSALRSYRKDWDEKNGVYRINPVHDWASHPADAFRYLSVAIDQISNDSQYQVKKPDWVDEIPSTNNWQGRKK